MIKAVLGYQGGGLADLALLGGVLIADMARCVLNSWLDRGRWFRNVVYNGKPFTCMGQHGPGSGIFTLQ